MNRLLLALAGSAAICACATTHGRAHVYPDPRAARPEELAVLEAALTDPQLLKAWGMTQQSVVVDGTECYDRPDAHLGTAFFSFARNENLSIDPSLPPLLATEGCASLSLRTARIPSDFVLESSSWLHSLLRRDPESAWTRFSKVHPETERVIFFGAPVIRGTHALVAVWRSAGLCCGDGYSIYLERTTSSWTIVAYGHFWSS